MNSLMPPWYIELVVTFSGSVAFVGQDDLEALVQEGQFAQPLGQGVVVEHRWLP